MKVEIVYTTHCKNAKLLAEDMARYVRTYAKPITDFDFHEDIDLLVIGFEEYPCIKDKELENFISQLSREHIKNLALFNLFCLKNKDMDKVIDFCQKQDLPLMRETYSCKKKLSSKANLNDDIISGGRVYIEDMVNICLNYYWISKNENFSIIINYQYNKNISKDMNDNRFYLFLRYMEIKNYYNDKWG